MQWHWHKLSVAKNFLPDHCITCVKICPESQKNQIIFITCKISQNSLIYSPRECDCDAPQCNPIFQKNTVLLLHLFSHPIYCHRALCQQIILHDYVLLLAWLINLCTFCVQLLNFTFVFFVVKNYRRNSGGTLRQKET